MQRYSFLWQVCMWHLLLFSRITTKSCKFSLKSLSKKIAHQSLKKLRFQDHTRKEHSRDKSIFSSRAMRENFSENCEICCSITCSKFLRVMRNLWTKKVLRSCSQTLQKSFHFLSFSFKSVITRKEKRCGKFRKLSKLFWCNHCNYYMASSASRQDEPNRALWLATRAGKMEPSCPLGTTRCILQAKFPQKPCNKSFIDQVCLVNNPYILTAGIG